MTEVRIRGLLCAALALLLPPSLAAQSSADLEAVRAAAMDYIERFYQGDTTRLVRSVSPEVFKYGYFRRGGGGDYQGTRMTWPEFMEYANGVKSGRHRTPADAPKEVQVFDVLDQTASVKIRAWWGTDYLLLARQDGHWRITHVLWQTPVR